ncbi:MAG: hypothetical protein NTW87_05790 [Planctomycetota bacterium]|nr:hypothetical protein [Planctomycetota bacterium]
MRALAFAIVILAVCGVAAVGDAETFAQRRQAFLDAVWSDFQSHTDKPSAKQAFFRAEALFELGKIDGGRRLVHRGLDQLVPGNRENRWIHGGNSGFVAWPGMDCYIRYERFLDGALKERYRKIYTGAVFYQQLSTSNHKIMAAVTRYLATQVWGDDAFKPDPFFQGKEDDGSRFHKSDPTGEKYVRSSISETVQFGPGEYASRPYGAENVLPLLTLAECARDAEIRQRAQLAYEYAIIQLVPAYLRGHLATFSPRSYPDMETQQAWGIAALAWAYFGGVPPATLHDQWALRAATAQYRLPAAIQPAGTDRSQPYVCRAHINRWALYHYVNKSYVLFSRSPKADTRQFMGQSYPCGVMWEEPDVTKGSHLWITNPAADDNNGADVNKPSGLHTHGVTKYEQEVQYKDALLFVFEIPTDFRNPYVLGFIPGSYRAVANDSKTSQRLFLHYGSVLVAVSAASPFEWDPASGIRAPAGKPREGDSEFRVMAVKTAVAVETASPAEFPGGTAQEQLEKFRQAVLATSKIELLSNEKTTGRYTDRLRNSLECVFDGPDRVNGQPVDYAAWPAIENPWMRQVSNSTLTITVGETVRTYDWVNWSITEAPAAVK